MKLLKTFFSQYIQGNTTIIEAGKLFTIALFAVLSLAVSIYFIFFSPYTGFRFVYIFIPHLYLIPIILLALWYPKSGVKLVIVILSLLLIFWIFTNVLGYFEYTPLFVILYTGIDLAAVMVFLLYIKDQRLVESVILELIERDAKRVSPSKITIDEFSGDFDAIIEVLSSQDENSKEKAILALSGLSDERAILPLISVLKDEKPYIRITAIEALGKTGSQKVVKPLIEILRDDDRYVREAAAEELGHLGRIALPELTKRISDHDWRVRMGIIIALRISPEIPETDSIIRALSDSSVYVRREAVKTLGRIGDIRVFPYLVESTKDPDPGVRLRAVTAITKTGSKNEIIPILNRCINDQDSAVRLRAKEEMRKISE